MRRREPGDLRLKSSRVHCQRALHDSGGDRGGDPSAVLTTLHHDRNHIFRLIEGRKGTEPRNRIFLSVGACLSCASFSRDLHVFQACTTACSAIFVHNFPKAAPNHLDLFARKIVAQIGIHLWLR